MILAEHTPWRITDVGDKPFDRRDVKDHRRGEGEYIDFTFPHQLDDAR